MRPSLVPGIVAPVAALAALAMLAVYLVTTGVVRSASDAELRRSVDTEIAALADIYATGGQAELVTRIGDRLALQPSAPDRPRYLIAAADGARIAGDISRWPLLSAENSEAGFVTLEDGRSVFARATQLDAELKLVAAREHGSRDALLARLGTAFLIAGFLVVLGAAGFGWFAAARLRGRVRRINAAFRKVESEGAQPLQLSADDRQDELGELSRHAERLIARLGTLLQAQRDVTDQIAHEIRTPLTHLENRVLKLIDHSVDPALVAGLGQVRIEARRVADLLDSLLDIAASRAGRGDQTGFEPVDLSELAESIVDLYADSAEEADLDLRAEIMPGVMMSGNAMQLTRLLTNLLDNAFKYVPAGGQVTVRVAPGPEVEVRDNGPGVPPELRERIFERFQRGGAAIPGAGLGLALARAIAERHGLAISCRDAAPGAVFLLRPEAKR
ncbi:sensor histidine kinase [Stakelama tenebrarum]|nr:HAMP domain-containing sensor histidine kinase [Sphingosinithalassobacter tenebrarum]